MKSHVAPSWTGSRHQLTYDCYAGAAYVYAGLRRGKKVSRSRELPNGLVVDYDADGKVLGVEILSPEKTTIWDVMKALGIRSSRSLKQLREWRKS